MQSPQMALFCASLNKKEKLSKNTTLFCPISNVMVAPNLLRVGTTEKVFVETQDYTGNDLQVKIIVKNFPKKSSELFSKLVILKATKNFQAVVDIKVGSVRLENGTTR